MMVDLIIYLDNLNEQFFRMIGELKKERLEILLNLDIVKKEKIDLLHTLFKLNTNSIFQNKLSEIMDDLISNLINILK